jgi:hypothetical protein
MVLTMANLLRISILGSLPAGEVWSVNPVFQVDDASTSTDFTKVQAVATAVAAIVMPAGLRAVMSTTTSWTGVRVEGRKWDGTLEAQAEAIKGTPTPGTGNAPHPFQTSMVSSLRTSTAGPSGRGRLYWPATGVQIDINTLRPSTATVGGFVTGVRDFLVSINGAVRVTYPGAVGLNVWSRKQLTGHLVTKILGGDVLDTQRRRRDTTVEGYTTLGFPV